MRKIINTLVFWVFSATACVALAADGSVNSLCQINERVVFSCELQNGKILSFCSTRGDRGVTQVEYRYGKPEKVELRYRSAAGTSKKIYFFDGVVRSGQGAPSPTLFFKSGNYGYFLSVPYSPVLNAYEAPTLFVNLEGSDYLDTSNEFACNEDGAGRGRFTMDLAPPHPALTPVQLPVFKAWQSRFRRANSYQTNP